MVAGDVRDEFFLFDPGRVGGLPAGVTRVEGGWARLYFPAAASPADGRIVGQGGTFLRMVHVGLGGGFGRALHVADRSFPRRSMAALLARHQRPRDHL